jgi:hypothetical protein
LFRNYCRFEGAVHEEITGFQERTELDFDAYSIENPSRFNILHYKSTKKQRQQIDFYAKIEKELNYADE